ncbi:hypothetical protein QQ045_013292 [Rhodiola kirilowii]
MLGVLKSDGGVMFVVFKGLACNVEDLIEKVTRVGCNENESWFTDHDRCWSKFDAYGNFYCPACSFEQAFFKCIEAKKQALLAKRALQVGDVESMVGRVMDVDGGDACTGQGQLHVLVSHIQQKCNISSS